MKELSAKEKWKSQLSSAVKKEIIGKVDQLLVTLYTTELEFYFSPSAITLYAFYSVLCAYSYGPDLFKEVIELACHFDADLKLPSEEEVVAKVLQTVEEVKQSYSIIEATV